MFLDLAPFIDLAKQRLSDAGLTAVNLVPEVHPTVELAKADTLVRAQTAYSTLDTVAGVLPWIVLLLLVVGVYLARNRFRALVGTGLGWSLSMVVLGAGLLVARSLLVGAVPAGAAPATASGFDIVVTYLRLGLRALLVLGLVLALAGFLAGRSESAVRHPAVVAGRLHGIRGGPAAAAGGHVRADAPPGTAHRRGGARRPGVRVPGAADRGRHPRHRGPAPGRAGGHRVPGPAGDGAAERRSRPTRASRSADEACPFRSSEPGSDVDGPPTAHAGVVTRLLAAAVDVVVVVLLAALLDLAAAGAGSCGPRWTSGGHGPSRDRRRRAAGVAVLYLTVGGR